MQSMSDHLFNQFDQKAKDWGEIYNDESADGRALLRRRNAYYKARRELTEYLSALERSIGEVEVQVELRDVEIAMADERTKDARAEIQKGNKLNESLKAYVEELKANNLRLQIDFDRVSGEIEARNRGMEKGPDEIGREYIRRLGIPELTAVFNRLVLGDGQPL